MPGLIDAHIHFWDPQLRHHEWLEQVPTLRRRFIPADVQFGPRIPDGLVFVEADCAPDEMLDEVDWVGSLAARGAPAEAAPAEADVPVVGIVAHAPLERGGAVEPLLDQLVQRERVVGVRRLLQAATPALLADPALVAGTRLLAARGLASDLCVRMEQLPAVTKLVRACPDTTFVLDHLAKPRVGERWPADWARDLRELASCSNVSCKLSGLATEAASGWRPHDLLPYLRHALDAFGAERCLFGSDWPVALLGTNYEAWLEIVQEAIADLGATEQAAVLGGNALRVYDLTIPSKMRTADAGS